MFSHATGQKIEEVYDMPEGKKGWLGSGAYGTVVKCTHKKSKKVSWCKMIEKKKVSNQDKLADEIWIMKFVDHPNVLKLYETFETKKTIYLVMEMCAGGELFDRINEAG